MEKRNLGIFGCILAIAILISYFAGSVLNADYWKNEVTDDDRYYRLLDDVYPKVEGEFSYIILRDDNYFVYHNCNETQYKNWTEQFSGVFPEWTVDFFNDYSIFHRTTFNVEDALIIEIPPGNPT